MVGAGGGGVGVQISILRDATTELSMRHLVSTHGVWWCQVVAWGRGGHGGGAAEHPARRHNRAELALPGELVCCIAGWGWPETMRKRCRSHDVTRAGHCKCGTYPYAALHILRRVHRTH
jgi:hypothetical protein